MELDWAIGFHYIAKKCLRKQTHLSKQQNICTHRRRWVRAAPFFNYYYFYFINFLLSNIWLSFVWRASKYCSVVSVQFYEPITNIPICHAKFVRFSCYRHSITWNLWHIVQYPASVSTASKERAPSQVNILNWSVRANPFVTYASTFYFSHLFSVFRFPLDILLRNNVIVWFGAHTSEYIINTQSLMIIHEQFFTTFINMSSFV